MFTSGQQLVFDFQGTQFLCRVVDLDVVDLEVLKAGRGRSEYDEQQPRYSGAPRGVLMHQTVVEFAKAHNSLLRLKGSKKA